MKKILSQILIVSFISSLGFAQNINIYTSGGTDVYSLVDVDSITFNVLGGTVTDIDGNEYSTLQIGEQWWMTQNLKVTHYQNGDAILFAPDTLTWEGQTNGAYCNYNNNYINVETYGRIYNWHAVDDSRNIAPEGWHVATDEDWKQLEMYLGMSQGQADSTDWRGTDEGGKLKEVGFTHWNDPNRGATNSSGFTAVPGGYRNFSGNYYTMGKSGSYWTATEAGGGWGWYRYLSSSQTDIGRFDNIGSVGCSVRCVKE